MSTCRFAAMNGAQSFLRGLSSAAWAEERHMEPVIHLLSPEWTDAFPGKHQEIFALSVSFPSA